MNEIFILICFTIGFSIFSVYCLVKYFNTKDKKYLKEMIFSIGLTTILSLVLSYKIINKSVEKAKEFLELPDEKPKTDTENV